MKRGGVTGVVVGALVLGAVSPAAASPAPDTFADAVLYSAMHPDVSLPGVNDVSCISDSEPVVLVHGFLENSYDNWASLAPKLVADGYCVYALDYGAPEGVPFKGLGSLADSAAELGAFVSMVRESTGADKVAIVGHSKGGTVPRYYVRFLGGAESVSKIVALSPPNHPTPGPPADEALGRLNEGSDTVPGVDYTTVVTRYDQVVPFEASLLTGPGNTNVVLQDVCPANTVEHTGISYDPVAQQVVVNALEGTEPSAVVC
ncbi:alpha/beta fold hydrolase [Rhodococcus sp. G-MC3]|uniref:esterase/lipase family protein n=1 Tax=Rhodococcus sp. G-MC3 TaxID=3046209 RepID=UPI0024BB3F7F|nr:alpha/beta fold hydrolase [Rhodococcus sp. G-MC3]MDJ0396290.1 alpha/beta fold hydrolase [Rhodococcus sp. G-MC3]